MSGWLLAVSRWRSDSSACAARTFRVHMQKRVERGIEPRDLIQRGLDEFAAGKFAALESGLHLGEGEGGEG